MSARKLLVAAGLAGGLFSGATQAAHVIDATSFGTGSTYTDPSGITFTAYNANGTLGNFTQTIKDNVRGAGVAGGRTGDELDVNDRGASESIRLTSIPALPFSSFRLGLLYDGPEYGDFQEVATVTGYNGDSQVFAYRLTATYTNMDGLTGQWSGMGTLTNLRPATLGTGAVWEVANPFGNQTITRLDFAAALGTCGTGLTCNNQSDYVLMQVALVPEPSEYAMMLAGLAAVGFIVRRRRHGATA